VISLDFKPVLQLATRADFTYSITPSTISISDTAKGRASVKNDIEAVLGSNPSGSWPRPFA
jgi:hypothetical protein